jgi:hypothetical protein
LIAKSMLISAKYRQTPQTENAMNLHHAEPQAAAILNAPVRFLRLFAGIIMDATRCPGSQSNLAASLGGIRWWLPEARHENRSAGKIRTPASPCPA